MMVSAGGWLGWVDGCGRWLLSGLSGVSSPLARRGECGDWWRFQAWVVWLGWFGERGHELLLPEAAMRNLQYFAGAQHRRK